MEFDNKLQNKMAILVGIILLVFIIKPTIMFKSNGKLRAHGFGLDHEQEKKTIFTFHIFVIITTIVLTMLY